MNIRTAAPDVAVHQALTIPCLGTADAVQHWSESAGHAECAQALPQRARVTLGLSVAPSSGSTWVCPTTADAAEHWVRDRGSPPAGGDREHTDPSPGPPRDEDSRPRARAPHGHLALPMGHHPWGAPIRLHPLVTGAPGTG